MFDHVSIRVSDLEASRAFYDTVLSALEIDPAWSHGEWRLWRDFSLAPADEGRPVTRRLHVAFVAPSRAHVDAFWRAGTEAGHASDGEPGPRPQYRGDYYGAFLLDPDGNSAEAVHHGALREGGIVDHLWIRVADVERAAAFYELVAPFGGFRRNAEAADRAQFVGATGSFSLVAGEPTANVHVAFPAAETATVDAFHRAALAAGHRDNGPPGERPQYHPGYYGAFVLDPDGHNVEVVCHGPR